MLRKLTTENVQRTHEKKSTATTQNSYSDLTPSEFAEMIIKRADEKVKEGSERKKAHG